eukprot:g4309.t1
MPTKTKGKKKGKGKKKKKVVKRRKKKNVVKEDVMTEEEETENEEEEEERLAVRIEELKRQVSALQNYNIKLRHQKKENQKKAVEFSKYFDREIQARDHESKELETLVNVQREVTKEDVRRASLQLLHEMNPRPEQHTFSEMIDDDEDQIQRAILELEKSIERGSKIDIQKLSWDLRVEFLKLLFARINAVHPSSRHEETRREEILTFLQRGGRDEDDEEEIEEVDSSDKPVVRHGGRAKLPALA